MGAVFVAFALALGGGRAGASVAFGGLVALLNLWGISRIVKGILSGEGTGASWGLVALFKILALFGGIFLVLRQGYFDLLPVVIGYGALPLGVVIGSTRTTVSTPLER